MTQAQDFWNSSAISRADTLVDLSAIALARLRLAWTDALKAMRDELSSISGDPDLQRMANFDEIQEWVRSFADYIRKVQGHALDLRRKAGDVKSLEGAHAASAAEREAVEAEMEAFSGEIAKWREEVGKADSAAVVRSYEADPVFRYLKGKDGGARKGMFAALDRRLARASGFAEAKARYDEASAFSDRASDWGDAAAKRLEEARTKLIDMKRRSDKATLAVLGISDEAKAVAVAAVAKSRECLDVSTEVFEKLEEHFVHSLASEKAAAYVRRAADGSEPPVRSQWGAAYDKAMADAQQAVIDLVATMADLERMAAVSASQPAPRGERSRTVPRDASVRSTNRRPTSAP